MQLSEAAIGHIKALQHELDMPIVGFFVDKDTSELRLFGPKQFATVHELIRGAIDEYAALSRIPQ